MFGDDDAAIPRRAFARAAAGAPQHLEVGMGDVVRLADFREAEAPLPDLAAMSYQAAVEWAGADFDRLVAVARARDYRPEWIQHQLENLGRAPSPRQADVLAAMIAAAGPYLSRRRRWIIRQLRIKPLTEKALTAMAAGAPEYRDLKLVDRAVANDVDGLVVLGLVIKQGGKVHASGSGPSAAPAQRGRACTAVNGDSDG